MQQIALDPFDAAAIVIVLAAALGYLNTRFLGLPHTIGLTIMGAVASLAVVAIDRLLPGGDLGERVRTFLTDLDFSDTLMKGMLSFLLFAGALHVNLDELRRSRTAVAVLSSLGVLLSTLAVGLGFRLLTGLIGIDVPLLWCLVFGALISPTDPVAVLGILRTTNVPPALQATVAGESLFNDGVGVVVFSILLAAATGVEAFSPAHAAELFLLEAVGGAALGLAAGWIGFRLMRMIDDYNVEVLISLAVVMGGYALAQRLHVSGPVAMAVAGLLIGSYGTRYAMSDTTRDHLLKFWSLLDEILNSVLFLLIGLEVIAIAADAWSLLVGVAAIPLVLLARALSVGPPLLALRRFLPLGRIALPILLWGGLRGGISIALALSLPAGPMKDLILTATYLVVLFSVIVQGATVGGLVKRLAG